MANKKEKLISIVIPCFNEEEAIPFFYNEITRVLKTTKYNYELLFVDDGSKDNTLNVLETLTSKDKHVLYLSFSRNFGKESAMYAGLVNAKGDYVTIMDADMQDPPSLLTQMIRVLESGNYDCAACRRVDRTGDSKIRSWFAIKFYKIINKISDTNIVEGARDYRLMTRKMVDAVLSMSEYNRFSKGVFSWVGFNTYWFEYENVNRIAGTTSWSFIGLTKYAIDGIINFSNAPLSVPIWLGVICVLICLIVLIKNAIIGCDIKGWTSIICVILLVGAAILFSIGIIGQYLGKTMLETKNRPHYIISKTNIKDSKDIR